MSTTYLSAEWRQCSGKHQYRNSRLAKHAARMTMTNHGGRSMSAYHCEWCAYWHIGHPSTFRLHQQARELSVI